MKKCFTFLFISVCIMNEGAYLVGLSICIGYLQDHKKSLSGPIYERVVKICFPFACRSPSYQKIYAKIILLSWAILYMLDLSDELDQHGWAGHDYNGLDFDN